MYTIIYVEEDVDGDTLLMLVTIGSMEQYKACGLATVKDQMKLRKLIGSLSHPQWTLHHSLVHHSQALVATLQQHHQEESFLRKCFGS